MLWIDDDGQWYISKLRLLSGIELCFHFDCNSIIIDPSNEPQMV